MKLIYVASPYRGDVEKNIEYAKKVCGYVVKQGHNFYCPHLLVTQILNDDIESERKLGINLGKDMMLKCDELWCFGDKISEGMFYELEFARENNIPTKRIASIEPKQVQSFGMKLC